MRKIKKWAALIMVLALLLCFPGATARADNAPPTRIINVVFDDSGSMIIRFPSTPVDTWCQAKYAMEVFAALLGENDTMNIYYMSRYLKDPGAAPLTLQGSAGAAKNVSTIHETVTNAADNTPFGVVQKACRDLADTTADEKWLVVLTDGEFDAYPAQIESFYASKPDDVHVMMLGIGSEAPSIHEDPANNVFYVKAEDSKAVLGKITDICTRVLNSDRLDVDRSGLSVSFDVPMSELIVFAQGAQVQISGLSSGGKSISPVAPPVTVQYSETASSNYAGGLVDRDLKGAVAVFRGDFVEGDYSLDLSGADTVEVYYKPNVEIRASLQELDGTPISNMSRIEAGDYRIEFGFVRAGTQEPVGPSRLLGQVDYSATVTSNGTAHPQTYSSGDVVHIDEGHLEIDATAHFLGYHHLSTHLSYTVFADKQLNFTAVDTPDYTVTVDGMVAPPPIRLHVQLEGEELTREQWEAMDLPQVRSTSRGLLAQYGDFTVEKGDQVGDFLVTPVLSPGLLSSSEYSDIEYEVSFSQKVDNVTWSGGMTGKAHMTDTRTWFERCRNLVIRIAVAAGIFLFLLGYVPGVKKYLPKRLRKAPHIECTPNRPGVHAVQARGSFSKNILTTLVPYKAEEGTLRFIPRGVTGVPTMKVRAAGNNGMLILNTRSYAGRDSITFNGIPVEEGRTKPMRIGAAAMLTVETPEMSYTCIPTQ